MTKTNKESKYIVACQNCMLPVSKCKGDCTRKQILKNAANADKTEVKNGKTQSTLTVISKKKTTRFTRLVVFAANKHCPTRRI